MTLDTFLALLEYWYTDHAPIEAGDAMEILALSNQYAVSRLVALCELYVSKEVERRTAESIARADLDVIGVCGVYMMCVSVWCVCDVCERVVRG